LYLQQIRFNINGERKIASSELHNSVLCANTLPETQVKTIAGRVALIGLQFHYFAFLFALVNIISFQVPSTPPPPFTSHP
jgi:hypothetical protein